jgi:hypothetical protein
MKTFQLKTWLTLAQVIQVRAFVGGLGNMYPMYDECKAILKTEGCIDSVRLSNYIENSHFKHGAFEAHCKRLAVNSGRPMVTIGTKQYYEDELATALASIKEVK